MEYTKEIHIRGLLMVFESKKPCINCPGLKMREFLGGLSFHANMCVICWDFILEDGEKPWAPCPCFNGNEAKATKRTWIVLEAGGHI